jgi:cytochrome c556
MACASNPSKGGVMKKHFAMVAGSVLMVLVVSSAYGKFERPDDAIAYRQSVMTLMGHHFGLMAAVIKSTSTYTKDVFAKNAQLVAAFAKLPWEAFTVAGSAAGNTQLKPEAFNQQAEFKEMAAGLESQTAKLADAAASGDINAIKAQFGEVGKSCKDCHTQFRKLP